jgi:hypothetical protein
VLISFSSIINPEITIGQNLIRNTPDVDADISFDKMMFLLIGDESFLCPSCLNHFLKFCEELKLYCQYDPSLCVFGVVDLNSANEERNDPKILMKQLKGFIKANDITFPVMIDSLNVFYQLKKKNFHLLFLDFSKNIEKMWPFPKSSTEQQEIFRYLCSIRTEREKHP